MDVLFMVSAVLSIVGVVLFVHFISNLGEEKHKTKLSLIELPDEPIVTFELCVAYTARPSPSNIMKELESYSAYSERHQQNVFGRVWYYARSLREFELFCLTKEIKYYYFEHDPYMVNESFSKFNDVLDKLPLDKLPEKLASPYKHI